MKIKLAIIGSTGSIGKSALDVVREHSSNFEVVALAVNTNVEKLAAQIEEFKPKYAAVANENAAKSFQNANVELLTGSDGVASAAALEEVDIALVSVVGIAGLKPSLAAVRAGKRLALATKEVLVAAGPLILEEAKKHGAEVLPVDSEHSAIFQCMQSAGARGSESVERLIITASGGPFRNKNIEKLQDVTPEEALAHPTWNMGSKISIDSATLMNKGLEVIEACRLFDIPAEKIDVVVHPQSIVHSLVEFCDSSVAAQLSNPDMRMPILYALTFPERWPLKLPRLNLAQLRELTFFEPDYVAFPCLGLAYEALKTGGTAPAVLNAANETAVSSFLENKIKFLDIPRLIENKLAEHKVISNPTFEDIVSSDAWARRNR